MTRIGVLFKIDDSKKLSKYDSAWCPKVLEIEDFRKSMSTRPSLADRTDCTDRILLPLIPAWV